MFVLLQAANQIHYWSGLRCLQQVKHMAKLGLRRHVNLIHNSYITLVDVKLLLLPQLPRVRRKCGCHSVPNAPPIITNNGQTKSTLPPEQWRVVQWIQLYAKSRAMSRSSHQPQNKLWQTSVRNWLTHFSSVSNPTSKCSYPRGRLATKLEQIEQRNANFCAHSSRQGI